MHLDASQILRLLEALASLGAAAISRARTPDEAIQLINDRTHDIRTMQADHDELAREAILGDAPQES